MNGVFDKKVKTTYIDTGERHKKRSVVLGAAFLFLCVFAGIFGLLASVMDSFSFEISRVWVAGQIVIYLLFFTVVYFLPSRILAFAALLGGGAALGFYIRRNLEDIIDRARAALNWCLFQISEAGYNIGPLLDRDLARHTNHAEYLPVFTLAVILLSGVFSYLIYSRKNVFFNLALSVAIIFPGFFYGLIPSYFSVSLAVSFWVANFAVNIFDSEYITRLLYKQSEIPEKKLVKIKLKNFRKEHRRSVKNIKAEIKEAAKAPDDNIFRLERLLRQLELYEKPGFLFLRLYGLGKIKRRKKKFVNLVKEEKQKLNRELKDAERDERLAAAEEKKAFKLLPFGQRLKIKLKYNFNEKKKIFTRNGYNAVSAFAAALVIITIVQPFIRPDLRPDRLHQAMPDDILAALTRAVEDILVGSDARVFGGYGGGMGGGDLYRPGGVRFRHVPILEIDLRGQPEINSRRIYLRGFVGSIYDGRRWIEADRSYIEDFNRLMRTGLFERYRPNSFFVHFMEFMHDATRASQRRRSAELVRDMITVQHVVVGGRLVFTPNFMNGITSRDFNIRHIADLNTHVTNSVFRRPRYTIDFYSTDSVLDRSPGSEAIRNMRDYLNRYMRLFTDLSFWTPEQIGERFPGARIVSRAQMAELMDSGEYSGGRGYFGDFFSAGYFTVPHFWSADGRYRVHSPNYILMPRRYQAEVTELRRESRFWYGDVVPEEFLIAEMAYYNFVREHYLQLPETLPEEVAELARSITRGIRTPFDKALEIEHFLSTNFEYTLNPRTPRDLEQDFVYSFLFDVREGYCSYYATAMTVMLRTLGIPAREVEGFRVDTRRVSRDEDGNPAAIVVLDSDAHAWTEVYLRGAGWVPFEPTASVPEAQAEERALHPPAPIDTFPEGFDEDEYGEEWDPYWDPGVVVAAPEEERDYTGLYSALLALLSLAIVISAFHFANYQINKRRRKYFETAGANAAALKMLSYILKILKLCGYIMRGDEGLIDFARRISHHFPAQRGAAGWEDFMRIMQKARYSIQDITEQEREYACGFIAEVRRECLKNLKFGLRFRLRFARFMI